MKNLLIYSLYNFLLFFILTKISYNLKLVDLPDVRKIHKYPTACTGGLIISINLFFAIWLFGLNNTFINILIPISFLMSLIGMIDDKMNLNAGGKLSLQILPIFYLILFQDLALKSIGVYYQFEIILNILSLPISLLSILFLINSFNYFDGIDGTLGISAISTFLILFFLISDESLKLFFLIIIITIFFFLIFNFSVFKLPKLFLGDSGSLYLGFIVSFILIYLANKNLSHPILLTWSIAIFVFEFISINIIRIKKKINILQPGKDHLHHLLYKNTKSIFKTNLIIFLMNIIFFIIGYLCFLFFNSLISLVFFILFFTIYFFIRYKYSKI